MDVSPDRVSKTIDRIYEAPVTGGGWEVALRSITNLLGAGLSTLTGSLDEDGPYRPSFIHCDIAMEHACEEYCDYYHSICERARYSRKEPVGNVYYDYKYLTETEIRRSEYYDYLIRNGGKYALGTTLNLPDTSRLTSGTQQCAVHFPDCCGHPDEEIIALFERLVPHLIRANMLSQHIDASSNLIAGLRSAVDNMPGAVFGLNESFGVEFANVKAEAVLRANDGISVVKRQLCLASPRGQDRLARLLSAFGRDQLENPAAPSVVRVDRPSGRRPYLVFVTPAKTATPMHEDDPTRRIRFLAIISDLNADPVDMSHYLEIVFGLTPAEAKLAKSLAKGLSLKDHREALEISNETAKWYLRQIFQKTGVNRQAELVALLGRIAPLNP